MILNRQKKTSKQFKEYFIKNIINFFGYNIFLYICKFLRNEVGKQVVLFKKNNAILKKDMISQ